MNHDTAGGSGLILWAAAEVAPTEDLLRLITLLPPVLIGLAMLCRYAAELVRAFRAGKPIAPADAPAPPR